MDFRKFVLLVLLLVILPWIHASSQAWVVPEDAAKKVCPFKFSKETVVKGQDLYQKNCQSCHGIPGQNNPAKITPVPEDPVTPKFQAQKDGEIFWKITTGKTPMPQFQNILKDDERWYVISYIRSFNAKYVQPAPELRTGVTAKEIKLSMSFLADQKKIRIVAMEKVKDKGMLPSAGNEIVLSVKRYFGELHIGDPKTTDKYGIAVFDAPEALPMDRSGKMEFSAQVNDPSGILGDTKTTGIYPVGTPNTAPSLIAQRAWFTTRDKAPVWLILTYSISVITVWGFILYILFSLRRLRKLNS
jgi:mono/diheme cytochrome c family protein